MTIDCLIKLLYSIEEQYRGYINKTNTKLFFILFIQGLTNIMEETINPLSTNTIKNILQTAQSLIGRSTIALEREFPRSRRKHVDSNAYFINYKESSIIWIPNIFNVCDISLIQFHHLVDTQNCCNLCNNTMETLKPDLWIDEDTIIQRYTEASGQNIFLVGWKYSCILR